MMFIHVFDESTYSKLEKKGVIPLKKDYPYIMLVEENTSIDFEDIDSTKYKISEVMYFQLERSD